MKEKGIHILLLMILLCAFKACDENTERICCPDDEHILIKNSSFEYLGKPSLEGWGAPYSNRITFSRDTPPMGGFWSVEIDPGEYPRQTYFIWYAVEACEGTHVYELSFWAKSQAPLSYAKIIVNHSQSYIAKKSIYVYTSEWNRYTTIDTLSTEIGDTILVRLEGGDMGGALDKARYDRIVFRINE